MFDKTPIELLLKDFQIFIISASQLMNWSLAAVTMKPSSY